MATTYSGSQAAIDAGFLGNGDPPHLSDELRQGLGMSSMGYRYKRGEPVEPLVRGTYEGVEHDFLTDGEETEAAAGDGYTHYNVTGYTYILVLQQGEVQAGIRWRLKLFYLGFPYIQEVEKPAEEGEKPRKPDYLNVYGAACRAREALLVKLRHHKGVIRRRKKGDGEGNGGDGAGKKKRRRKRPRKDKHGGEDGK